MSSGFVLFVVLFEDFLRRYVTIESNQFVTTFASYIVACVEGESQPLHGAPRGRGAQSSQKSKDFHRR